MKINTFHRWFYTVLSVVIRPFITKIFNFHFDVAKPKNQPFIVLSNHVTNWDPLFVGLSFPQMYFVASEHLFRIKFISSILKFLVAPILRVKARTEMHTAINILRAVKAGYNVCMFAEGSCSWNGETGNITEATAKLIKRSGATLYTYRLRGGYFTYPRWAKYKRKGILEGQIVTEYSPSNLSIMNEEEIYACIKRDLYVNAYEDNVTAQIEYNGHNLAESLETALFTCPECKQFGTLKSDGDEFSCSCGMQLRYTTKGLFESLTEKAPPFETILAWDRWQRSFVKEKSDYHKNLPKDTSIVSDKNQQLFQFEAGDKTTLIAEGDIILYPDRLVLTDTKTNVVNTFPLEGITDMAIIQKTLLTFSVKGKSFYEVKCDFPRSSLKYLLLCKSLAELRIML